MVNGNLGGFNKAKAIRKRNGTTVIQVYKAQPSFLKGKSLRCRPVINYEEKMWANAYCKTLKRKYRELVELDLDANKCKHVTLTIGDEKYNDYNIILKSFGSFMQRIRRYAKKNSNSVKVIRFVEIQNESRYFHIHIILVFSDKPPALLRQKVYDYWDLGSVDIDNVYEIEGLFQYLTNPKEGAFDKDNKKLTLFPKAAQIIHIGRGLPKASVEEINSNIAKDVIRSTDREMVFWHNHKYVCEQGVLRTSTDRAFYFYGLSNKQGKKRRRL